MRAATICTAVLPFKITTANARITSCQPTSERRARLHAIGVGARVGRLSSALRATASCARSSTLSSKLSTELCAVGKDRAEDVSVLLRLDGEEPCAHDLHDGRLLTALGGRRSTFFVLLALPFYQPWVQVFVVGVAQPEGAQQEAPAEPPYTVTACIGPSMISKHFDSVVCSHTGALAEHMARTFARWTITRMRERPLTPLTWRVLGCEGVPIVVDASAIAAAGAARRSEVFRELASVPARVRLRGKTKLKEVSVTLNFYAHLQCFNTSSVRCLVLASFQDVPACPSA